MGSAYHRVVNINHRFKVIWTSTSRDEIKPLWLSGLKTPVLQIQVASGRLGPRFESRSGHHMVANAPGMFDCTV